MRRVCDWIKSEGRYIYREREKEKESKKRKRKERKKRTQELWMGRRRGEPQQTVSSVGTTAGRHSQKGRERASRQEEQARREEASCKQ